MCNVCCCVYCLCCNFRITQKQTKHKYKANKTGGENLEKYLNCRDIADRYGVQLITVWDWIRKKKLPAIKIGKEYRIKTSDLERFEKERRTMVDSFEK